MKLKYIGEGESLDLWGDAKWGGENKRSTSGFFVKMFGNSIAWGTKRQTVVALSTCAAEYIALLDGAQHLESILILLDSINHSAKMNIFCNNETAILIAGDNTSKKKTDYLIKTFYFINNFIRQYDIKIQWKSTQDQLADIFTKRLGPNLVKKGIQRINLERSRSQPREGVLEY